MSSVVFPVTWRGQKLLEQLEGVARRGVVRAGGDLEGRRHGGRRGPRVAAVEVGDSRRRASWLMSRLVALFGGTATMRRGTCSY
jgi:hypothetical protein